MNIRIDWMENKYSLCSLRAKTKEFTKWSLRTFSIELWTSMLCTNFNFKIQTTNKLNHANPIKRIVKHKNVLEQRNLH